MFVLSAGSPDDLVSVLQARRAALRRDARRLGKRERLGLFLRYPRILVRHQDFFFPLVQPTALPLGPARPAGGQVEFAAGELADNRVITASYCVGEFLAPSRRERSKK